MPTILVADDYPSIREFLKRELEEEGYRVLVAGDGKEAVDLVQSEGPDLVILDICMPRANGFEAAQRIAAMTPDIGIILCTSNDELCIHDPRSAFATACVEKSDDLTELKLAIVSILARRSPDSLFRTGLPPVLGRPEVAVRSLLPEAISPHPRNQ